MSELVAYADVALDADVDLRLPLCPAESTTSIPRTVWTLRARALGDPDDGCRSPELSSDLKLRRGLGDTLVAQGGGGEVAWIDRGATRIEYAAEGAGIRHFLLDQILPRVLAGKGMVMVHGATLAIDEAHAVVFAGNSGAGKSTLTVALAGTLDALADDCALVDTNPDAPRVWPTYSSARLWPDSAAHLLGEADRTGPTKTEVFLTAHAPRAYLLEKLIVLGDPADRVTLQRVPGGGAVELLIRHLFRLDRRDRHQLHHEMEVVTRLAARIPVLRLSYPRKYDALEEVRRTLLPALRDLR